MQQQTSPYNSHWSKHLLKKVYNISDKFIFGSIYDNLKRNGFDPSLKYKTYHRKTQLHNNNITQQYIFSDDRSNSHNLSIESNKCEYTSKQPSSQLMGSCQQNHSAIQEPTSNKEIPHKIYTREKNRSTNQAETD